MEIKTRAFRHEDLEACLEIEKAAIKGGYQIIFNFYQGGKSKFTMVDLCMGPRSELHELYGHVSRAVHGAAWRRGSLSASRTIVLK